ncbi:MAG TPA: hypothetical protein VFP68_03135 [Burkholderiaceae bacterium]|nr:hypothetical protein [Burkholderiaceae bacterium]
MSRWLFALVVALVLPGCLAAAFDTPAHRTTLASPLHGLAPFAEPLSPDEDVRWQKADISSVPTVSVCAAEPGCDDEQLLNTADGVVTEGRWTAPPLKSGKLPRTPFLEGLERPPRHFAG